MGLSLSGSSGWWVKVGSQGLGRKGSLYLRNFNNICN